MKTVADFIFLGSKITMDNDYSSEIKRHLLFGRKAMTNLDGVLKSRDITLQTKVHIIKAMVFLAVIYESKSWTPKRPERQRIDAFKLWCWRRFLRAPWTARRSNQSILKEINWIFIQRTDSEAPILWPSDVKSRFTGKKLWCWERLKAEVEEDNREWDVWMASPTQWTWV